jgi:hypothetical protein
MADVYQSLYGRLSGFAGLTALTSTRIFPAAAELAKPAFPYVTYERVSTVEPFHTMGLSTAFEEMAQFRFHVWAKTNETQSGLTGSIAVAKQIRLAIHGWSDAVVDCVMYDSEAEIAEAAEGVFHRVLDFTVTHTTDVA